MLQKPLRIGNIKVANPVVLQPMEGCDCNTDGAPSELTAAKYIKAAKSGAGTVWFEANAVCPEGRTNPRQMMLTKENLSRFKSLLTQMRSIAKQEFGIEPIFILQLTHSGRQSITPMIAYHNPIYEQRRPVSDENTVTDAYLDSLPQKYVASARLALEAGFDGVDVKSCHGYLFQELLSAFQRKGRYGGSFENRSRLYLDCVEAVKSSIPDGFILSTRLSVSDMVPRPYGFGTTEENELDLTEPDMLIERLIAKGLEEPPLSILANECGITVEEAAEALAATAPVSSLNAPSDDGHAPADYYLTADNDPSDTLCESIALKSAIRQLTPMQQKIVYLRYQRDLSQSDVGRILSLSQVKVSREEKKILALLKQSLSEEDS